MNTATSWFTTRKLQSVEPAQAHIKPPNALEIVHKRSIM